jgi:hypothetical protein
MSLPAWVKALADDSFMKRRVIRLYVQKNLESGQVSLNRTYSVLWASRGSLAVRSAYDSARAAYRDTFSVYRSV